MTFSRAFGATLALCLAASAAHAQSSPDVILGDDAAGNPIWQNAATLTTSQWEALFSAKQDVLASPLGVNSGGTGLSALGTGVQSALGQPVNASGGLLTFGKIGTAGASLCLANGACTISGSWAFNGALSGSAFGPGVPYAISQTRDTVNGVVTGQGLGIGVQAALANAANGAGGVLTDAAIGSQVLSVSGNAGLTTVTGAGASTAATLANRATDGGARFNLKTDFGAACDGSTDDTAAIRAWLAKAGPGVNLVLPAGDCRYTVPLATAKGVSKISIEGAGKYASSLTYAGADTSATATASGAWTGGTVLTSSPWWTAGSTTITLSSAAPAFVATNLAYGVTIWDTTDYLAGNRPTPVYVGMVAAVSGSTITLTGAGAANGSVGSSDSLQFTVDLLTINGGALTGIGDAIRGVDLADFRMASATPLSGGYALRSRLAWSVTLRNVALGSADLDTPSQRLCGGLWQDGSAGVHVVNPSVMSSRSCGDAYLSNSTPWLGAIDNAELVVTGGLVGGDVQGGLLSGFHLAGGMGGVRCDGTAFSNNGYGVIVDNSVTPRMNREVQIGSSCGLDTPSHDGVLLDDPLVAWGTADIAGWEASAIAGHGIHVKHWGGKLQVRSPEVYNNCGSGLMIEDASTHVLIDPASAINANGANLGAACTAWKSANSGHGYGIEASVATSNIVSFNAPFANGAGPSNANTGLLFPSFGSYGGLYGAMTLSSPAGTTAKVVVNATPSSGTPNPASVIGFSKGGAEAWEIVYNPADGTLSIQDEAHSFAHIWQCASGGTCSFGEAGATVTLPGNEAVGGTLGVTGATTFYGGLAVAGTSTFTADNAYFNASSANAVVAANGTAGNGSGFQTRVAGTPLAEFASTAAMPFYVYDFGSGGSWIACSSSTTCAIGEGGSAVTTINGTLGLTAATWASSKTCAGTQISADASYLYVCTASGTKRAVLAGGY